jgi:hypothetical protein
MTKRVLWCTMAPALLLADVAIAQQYPMLDAVPRSAARRRRGR